MRKKTATVNPHPRHDSAIQEDLPPKSQLVAKFRKLEKAEGGIDAARMLLTSIVLDHFHDQNVKAANESELHPHKEQVKEALESETLSYIASFGRIRKPTPGLVAKYVLHLITTRVLGELMRELSLKMVQFLGATSLTPASASDR
ncbi:MAG TPA: hypothetical protein VM425_06325 [Myxococcota bacterium]|nr:hypothetical protein [Myxococcota bacterium]